MVDREHDTTADCWCRPVRDAQEPTVIVHNQECAGFENKACISPDYCKQFGCNLTGA